MRFGFARAALPDVLQPPRRALRRPPPSALARRTSFCCAYRADFLSRLRSGTLRSRGGMHFARVFVRMSRKQVETFGVADRKRRNMRESIGRARCDIISRYWAWREEQVVLRTRLCSYLYYNARSHTGMIVRRLSKNRIRSLSSLHLQRRCLRAPTR